ncbi:MAG: hypothetical protein ACYDEW_04670 [Vulcanimicrobiaceae bacterium]
MNDSWETFASALLDESQSLANLNAAAIALTQILPAGDPAQIIAADRAVDSARRAHQGASARRRGIQARGFGAMTLQQVCRHAPIHMAAHIDQRFSEIAFGSISLRITVANNKALIVAGLERLLAITAKLQESVSDRSGVYKRRGFVAPPSGSVLVSSKA